MCMCLHAAYRAHLQGFGATAALKAAIEDKANANARQAGLVAYAAVLETVGTGAEPFLAPLLPAVLEQCGDKVGARCARMCTCMRDGAAHRPGTHAAAVCCARCSAGGCGPWMRCCMSFSTLAQACTRMPPPGP